MIILKLAISLNSDVDWNGIQLIPMVLSCVSSVM